MSEKKKLDKLIGENIRRERVKAGYTQEKFSELIGIGPKSLSAVERGAVGISMLTLIRIVNILNISAGSILFENQTENDVSFITEKLERLTPEELKIAESMLLKLIEAFKTGEKRAKQAEIAEKTAISASVNP